MQPIYKRLRERARQIVAGFPPPDFYRDHHQAAEYSRQFLKNDPILIKLRQFVSDNLADNLGHGLEHAIKVTEDAGAILYIEGQAAVYSQVKLERRMCIVQCAGLLHDIKRKKKDHAVEGAAFSQEVLQDFPLSARERDYVSSAIRNHEAFKEGIPIKSPDGVLIDGCLYDADKFRWGPDNFTDTLWDMVAFFNPSVADFVIRYPGGMQRLEEIKATFRSHTGKKYGPQMIDFGIIIGQELMTVILTEFSHMLQ